MKTTTAFSIAAMLAALSASQALAIDLDASPASSTNFNLSLGGNEIDAHAPFSSDVDVQGSVDVYEG